MSAPVIPGVPIDGLKPADLLWTSILSKPLLFPPSPHSHGVGELPANIAIKNQSNTFTADQNFLLGNSAIDLTISGWPSIAMRNAGQGENKFVSPAGDVNHNQFADTLWSTNVGIENFRISNVGNVAARGNINASGFYATNGSGLINSSGAKLLSGLNGSDPWLFLTGGGAALGAKLGSLTISDNYGDSAPANGLLVKGNIVASGEVQFATGTWHKSTDNQQRFYFAGDGTTYLQGYSTHPLIIRNGAGSDLITVKSSGLTLVQGQLFVGSGTATDGRPLIAPNYDGSVEGHFASGLVVERGTSGIGLAWGMYQNNSSTWLSGWDYAALPRTALLNDFNGLRFISTSATTALPGTVLPVQPTTKFSVSPAGAATFSGSVTAEDSVACRYGLMVNEVGTGAPQWLMYKNAGTNQPLYFRDMVHSRTHMALYPGASSGTAVTEFVSQVTLQNSLNVVINNSHIAWGGADNNYFGGITYFRAANGATSGTWIDGTTGNAAFGGQAIADSLAVTTSARIGAGALGGLLYFGNGSNWIYQDSNSFYIDSNGGGVQFRNALTALPYFRVTAAGHVTTWGAIDSTGSVNSNRSLSLGNDNLGAETITFTGVIPAYRTVIENNWNSDRSFAITNGGYDILKCSNGGYTSITIGSDITQSTIIKGNPQAVGFTAIEPGKGAAAIAAGGFSGTGFFAWFKPGGTRQGYVGFDSGENIGFVNERSGGMFTFNAAVEVASHVTAGFQSLSADPTTLDLTAGQSRLVKNTTSGLLRLWANDGGTMKSVTLT